MKGNERVIETLNSLLSDELTAVNQYMVHAEMAANWGYKYLHEEIEKRAITEMKHAAHFISRILFLDGVPVVSQLKAINIGATVDKQLVNDWQAERTAVIAYNDGIKLCVEMGDNGSRELLESHLKDEECHLDWTEAQIEQINQMGLENYLSVQVRE